MEMIVLGVVARAAGMQAVMLFMAHASLDVSKLFRYKLQLNHPQNDY